MRQVLTPLDPSWSNRQIGLAPRHLAPPMFPWLHGDSAFRAWLSGEEKPILWIHGTPGSGKTTLCDHIIPVVRETPLGSPAPLVLSHFFNPFDTRTLGDQGLLESLASQFFLQTQDPTVVVAITRLEHGFQLRELGSYTYTKIQKHGLHRWTLEDLWTAIAKFIAHHSHDLGRKTVIIIDAVEQSTPSGIDECAPVKPVMLNRLLRLCASKEALVKVLVTSRFALKKTPDTVLTMDLDKATVPDRGLVIKRELHKYSLVMRASHVCQWSETLSARGGPPFLQLDLLLQLLARTPIPKTMTENPLPPETLKIHLEGDPEKRTILLYQELFSDLVKDIRQSRPGARTAPSLASFGGRSRAALVASSMDGPDLLWFLDALGWILHATQPLTLHQLCIGVQLISIARAERNAKNVSAGDKRNDDNLRRIDEDDEEEHGQVNEDVMTFSKLEDQAKDINDAWGILSTKLGPLVIRTANDKVNLCHSTVRQFLLDQMSTEDDHRSYSHEWHCSIASACLQYLMLEDEERMYDSDDLHEYDSDDSFSDESYSSDNSNSSDSDCGEDKGDMVDGLDQGDMGDGVGSKLDDSGSATPEITIPEIEYNKAKPEAGSAEGSNTDATKGIEPSNFDRSGGEGMDIDTGRSSDDESGLGDDEGGGSEEDEDDKEHGESITNVTDPGGLFAYASLNWFKHCRLASELPVGKTTYTRLIELVCEFLLDPDKMARWNTVYSFQQRSSPTLARRLSYRIVRCPVSIASYLGLTDVVEVLLPNASLEGNVRSLSLTVASQNGHLNVVERLLAYKLDPQVDVPKEYFKAVSRACRAGHVQVVELICDWNKEVTSQSHPMLRYFFQISAIFGQEATMSCIYKRLGKLSWGLCQRLMYKVAGIGHLETFNLLLAYYDAKAEGSANNAWEPESPFISASHNGHFGIVQSLLSGPPRLNITNIPEKTSNMQYTIAEKVFRDVVTKGSAQIAKLMLSHIGKQKLLQSEEEVEQLEDEDTPLHIASSRGYLELVTVLLEHEANPYAGIKGTNTPLDNACTRNKKMPFTDTCTGKPVPLYNNPQIVDLLCKAASQNRNSNDQDLRKYRDSALSIAIKEANPSHVRTLLRWGANPNSTMEKSPLLQSVFQLLRTSWAVVAADIFEALVDFGADMFRGSNPGPALDPDPGSAPDPDPPLLLAIRLVSAEVPGAKGILDCCVKALLKMPILKPLNTPNTPSWGGAPPIFYFAASPGANAQFKSLLKAAPDVIDLKAKDSDGRTILDVALDPGIRKMIQESTGSSKGQNDTKLKDDSTVPSVCDTMILANTGIAGWLECNNCQKLIDGFFFRKHIYSLATCFCYASRITEFHG